ncbi:unnamed protein product [Cuscuta campestris]|uniref:R3H domain-containing protein n=1 Tax=Cuscuta campestris TaxID=132261 RepID=A0A484LZ07_9ASTE|nr:unnamed protein product [Cuscuta campestris]
MPTSPSGNHGSPMRFVSFRRPIITLSGGDPVHTLLLEHHHKSPPVPAYPEIESFQSQVSTLFHDLSLATPKEFLSISWIRKLLAVFSACHEDFRSIVSSKKKKNASMAAPSKQRILTEYFDRTIKALDMLNAARDGLEKINAWQRHLEIVICALGGGRTAVVGEGNLRRARKALVDLALEDHKDDSAGGGVFSNRSLSFKRRAAASKDQNRPPLAHTRSLSWSVSNSWSASKQLQLLANAVQSPPRAADVAATDGLATLLHTMSFILVFVLWALAAVVPCQDRGTHTAIVVPRQSWSSPFHILQARITEESKRRRRNSNGLLKEICRMEEGVSHLTEFVESAQLPLSEEHKDELRGWIHELMSVSDVCKIELKPLERDIRDAFRKIVSCRIEGLEFQENKT